MKKQTLMYITWSLLTLIIISLLLSQRAIPSITYFPIDENISFEKAATSLTLSPETMDKMRLEWKTTSQSDQVCYLRQDISLLFANGKLKGVKTKWEDHTDIVNMEENLSANKNKRLEAISFHHGEIQYSNTDIKSIQQTSFDYLYIIESPTGKLTSFREPHTKINQAVKQKIDKETNKDLLTHWNKLAAYYNISFDDYLVIPLLSLYKYNDQPLPNMTVKQTERILGQLWEGIYKNYVLPATETKSNHITGFEPIILLDKNQAQILVLFELNNQKEMLIQKINQ